MSDNVMVPRVTGWKDREVPESATHFKYHGEDDVTFPSCVTCGAVVRDEDADLHAKWHETLRSPVRAP